jgi:hypothetical protein
MDYIRTICDSMLITDEFGGLAIRARMDLVPSAIVANSSVNEVEIILWGPKPVPLGVKPTLPEIPKGFGLSQNYPNPFNPSTAIRYSLPQAGFVTLKIYGILGQEITALVEGQRSAGQYVVGWDGRNRQGSAVGSGVYLYRLVVSGGSGSGFVLVRKMTLVR